MLSINLDKKTVLFVNKCMSFSLVLPYKQCKYLNDEIEYSKFHDFIRYN